MADYPYSNNAAELQGERKSDFSILGKGTGFEDV